MTSGTAAAGPSLIWTDVSSGRLPAPDSAEVLRQFPPRGSAAEWPATRKARDQVTGRLLAAPFALGSRGSQRLRARSLQHMLDWLDSMPGSTWQERWLASGAEGTARWRELAGDWLGAAGRFCASDRHGHGLGGGLLLLICGEVIRPGLSWLLADSGLQLLTAEMARTRDPGGFALLRRLCETEQASPVTRDLSLRRIAAIMAAKGGMAGDITPGDCLELAAVADGMSRSRSKGMYFYQMLRAVGVFPRRRRPACACSLPGASSPPPS